MRLERRWGIALAAIFAAAVVTTAAARSSSDPPVPDAVRGCKTRGDSNRPSKPPVSGAIRIGPVIIWPTIRSVGPTSKPAWPYVAKAPVMLPARARATLAIAPEAVGTAGLSDMKGGYVSSVRFLACRQRQRAFGYRGTVGKYTGFPFAFAIKEPSACVPMEVWLDGQSEPQRLTVPVGRDSC